MAQPLNALELLQSYRANDARQAALYQQMDQANQLLPLKLDEARQNMLIKQRAMDIQDRQQNALMDFGRTGNINALAMADPKTALALRTTQDRNALARETLASRERIAQGRLDAMTRNGQKAPPGYRFTQSGDLEAIPGGPADLKSRADAERKASGVEDVDVALGTLRNAYDRLEQGGGITSTKNSAAGNILPALSSSAAGQATGKLFGTENQSARNDIAMARPALLASLMRATGMSAKQMDSNAELKLWLATATDPTLDVESNRRALANIERKYITRSALKDSPPGTDSGGGGGADALTPAEQKELEQLRARFKR